MRLPPAPRRSPLIRLMAWIFRRRFGRVPGVVDHVYAHAPHLARTSASIAGNVDRRLSLDEPLRILVMAQSSMINGCAFCEDLHRAEAVQARLGPERFRDLPDFRHSPHFDERERAALAYTEEVTRERKCSDATFAALRRHFDEREIVELTWLNAVGNFYNLIAMPLGLESEGIAALAASRAA